jgi:hypothetical protein
MTTPQEFVKALAETRLPSVFNPYADHCGIHDKTDAASIRKRNLVRCLEGIIDARCDTIWIARDLGYRGGRRTGVPLTDETHLPDAAVLMGGVELDRATRGPIVAERTAAVVWSMLNRIGVPAMLWNIFPLHPHEPDDPMSNRCHTKAEREATWPLLLALFEMINPRRIVAIGRDAALALHGINTKVELVRHPSYGGQTEFISGICQIYGLNAMHTQATNFELPFPTPRAAADAVA